MIKDPPFSKLDLICCRNLLIYLDAELQKRIMPLFHYALNPGGFLFLGTSETVGESGDLFTAVNRKMKIFQRKEPPGAPCARLRRTSSASAEEKPLVRDAGEAAEPGGCRRASWPSRCCCSSSPRSGPWSTAAATSSISTAAPAPIWSPPRAKRQPPTS